MRWCTIFLICLGFATYAAVENSAGKGGSRQPVQNSKCNDVPARPFDLILGRPESNSVTLSVLCYSDVEGFISYGTQSSKLDGKTPVQKFKKGEPVEIVLDKLQPDTAYFYQLNLAAMNSGEFTFHTARQPGSNFTFTVTADSHLDSLTDATLYQRTLAVALACKPDFHIDLGDTFMTEKHENRAAALKQYLSQRYYFGQLCHSAPLFLVIGNHDGEDTTKKGAGEKDGLAAWSCETRVKYFPNPVPDNFYSGNLGMQSSGGYFQDYYSWNWGDALFIVIDPYRYSKSSRGGRTPWKMTMGAVQYQWLAGVLRESRAKFKFVFIHQLIGGMDSGGRGGIEAASLYEWGGTEPDGTNTFSDNRAGWKSPVHNLLVETGVTIVFHGHDHFFARQEKDGIIYQLVPQPATLNVKRELAKEYGYLKGDFLPNSGCLRVNVTPDGVKVEYLRTAGGAGMEYLLPVIKNPMQNK